MDTFQILNSSYRAVRALALLALLAANGACSNGSELSWTEDVSVIGGPTVAVKRTSEFKAPGELGQAPGESRYSLEFKSPTTSETVKFSVALRGTGAEMEQAVVDKK